uniref:Zinc knuckle CX2CX4HX4C domain-containing protein n=1 Tax=Quercus lobata TaxID=97700 RepID=A0A7N2N8K3_QUELO
MGSDGKRHWVDYKYERLPVFCHYCGVLGHDLRYRPAHYEESKKSTTTDYQYGDQLRASNGRNRSPPHQRNASSPGDELFDKEDNHTVERSGIGAVTKTAAKVLTPSDMQTNQFGNNDLHGVDPDIQANISEVIAQVTSCMDNHVPSLVPGVDSDLNLKVDNDNGLKEINKEHVYVGKKVDRR